MENVIIIIIIIFFFFYIVCLVKIRKNGNLTVTAILLLLSYFSAVERKD
jgi:hypothetical protein